MNVCVPHELYRNPRLRQAARTLCASGRDAVDSDGGLDSFTLRQRITLTDKSIQYDRELLNLIQIESSVIYFEKISLL